MFYGLTDELVKLSIAQVVLSHRYYNISVQQTVQYGNEKC